MKEKMFTLIDCNNFYASCERVFNPALNGKPVVVLSNNDGCVVARSNEAKEIGVPMGAPAYQYESFFKKHRVNVFSSNYALYGDMSGRVMSILSSFSPEIELYSIDESFLKFEHCAFITDFTEYGLRLRKTVLKSTGIPVSVGFAPTKALAKLSNRIAKKFNDQTGGVYCIDTEEKRIKALKWLKTEDVWGIGRRHAARLKKQGVHTAFDFTQLPDDRVRKQMSVMGLRLKHDLEGKPTLDLEDIKTKKSIATTRSFRTQYTEYSDLRERVSTFAVQCAEKLRKQKSDCNAVMVFVYTNPHRKDLPQYRQNAVINLPYPTNSSMELSKFAGSALKRIFKKGYSYKKAGVVVMDITPVHQRQLNLFHNSGLKQDKLMEAVDRINEKMNAQKVIPASMDIKNTWKMRREKLSPKYTTDLKDIITVK